MERDLRKTTWCGITSHDLGVEFVHYIKMSCLHNIIIVSNAYVADILQFLILTYFKLSCGGKFTEGLPQYEVLGRN